MLGGVASIKSSGNRDPVSSVSRMGRVETFRGFISLWWILFFCGFSCWSYGEFVPEEMGKKLVMLFKVVGYIHQRPYQMNADTTFSLTIVEANVAAALLHENAQQLEDKHRNMLESILHLCDSTRRQLLKKVIPENNDVRLLHETLNDPVLWTRNIPWRDNVLEKGSVKTKLTDRDVRDLIMQGTPQEKESDQCLAGIVRNRLNWNYSIPDLCLEILTSREIARGYPLTHRLLIVLVARVQHDNTLPMKELIMLYCSAILRDLIDIQSAGFPYQTPDLMMEQVVLCGMEGFLEFTRSYYEQLILSWAHPSGCFSSFGKKSDNQPRIFRRASKETDFGCDSHATGVAAAALSLFIRKNLETGMDTNKC